MNIFIGGAWPYANGSLHIGHIAALLPGDVIARYYRLKGDNVLYVAGSDCHGTPISIRAKNEGISPSEVALKYHNEFKYCFNKLNFSYDVYSNTEDEYHKREIQRIVRKLYDDGYIYEKEVKQLYCENCKQFLPDRYVEGKCPKCGATARGDQCDECGTLLDPLELTHRKCKLCGSEPVVKSSKQLYFALSKFQNIVRNNLEKNKDNWRINAVNNTDRYLNEGLCDRAISRDLSWGIDIPIEGYEDKKVYVWIDAVLGYLTMSKKYAEEKGFAYKKFWNEDVISIYVHGKDNIPFHSVILPALLSAIGEKKLPDRIISSEYLTLDGKKISTSKNYAIWIPDIVDKYNTDALRYFFIKNAPERRDTDFSIREFIKCNNGELLGAYGNLVNRTLAFNKKYFNNKILKSQVNDRINKILNDLYATVGQQIAKGELKDSLEDIFTFVRSVNKYFDEEKPWVTIKDDTEKCNYTIYNCIFAIANIANLLSPFLPQSSEKVNHWLGSYKNEWKVVDLKNEQEVGNFSILFERL